LLYQGWGRRKIQAALFAKFLPSSIIDQALESIDETEYFDTLKRIIATKKRSIKANDSQAREKMIRFCMQRGFTYDEIGDLV
jgi:regulatory protein